MRRGVLLFVWWALFLLPRARGAEPAESLFLKANDLFQAGLDSPTTVARAEKIGQAVSLYERIIAGNGIRSGYLYYNLGNCYFHLGQLGKAILNYRRAERLLPNFSDLKHNLRSAQERRKDRIRKSQIRSISRTLFFWHYLVSLPTKIVVFSVAFSMIWIVLLLKLFLDRPVVRWGLAGCIFFAVVFGASAALESYREHVVRFGVILAEETVPRKGPGESYEASFKEALHEGTEFRLRDRQGGWLRIELDSGAGCWVNARHAELI